MNFKFIQLSIYFSSYKYSEQTKSKIKSVVLPSHIIYLLYQTQVGWARKNAHTLNTLDLLDNKI